MERLSNDLNRVVRLTNWHEPIIEGYFPKLDSVVANRVWPPRPANTKLNVLIKLIISSIIQWAFSKCNLRIVFMK